MKRIIQKSVALFTTITIIMSTTSKVHANSYEVENDSSYSIAEYSINKAIIKYPDKPNIVK